MIGVDTVLGLPGSCLRLAAHPLGFAPQSVAHAVELGSHSLIALLAPPQIIFEIAVVGKQFLTVDLDYPVAHTVKKISVMSHHEQRGPRLGEIRLKPLYDVEIEMIGRLVEYEHRRLVEQRGRKRHALTLSAREMIHRLGGVIDAQLREQLRQAILEVPSRSFVHAVRGLGYKHVVATRKSLAIGTHSLCSRSVGHQTGIKHGCTGTIHRQLRQIAYAQAAPRRHRTAVGSFLPGYDTQHG